MVTEASAYFRGISEISSDLIKALPIPAQLTNIGTTFAVLEPAIEAMRPLAVRRLVGLERPHLPEHVGTEPAGMNTVGILSDRLTILVAKEWYLRHRNHNTVTADRVRREHIPDVVRALSAAKRGHQDLLEKVSIHSYDGKEDSFAAAYFGLLAANILMWETQEVLYLHNLEALHQEELKDYIRFFTKANMMRNACISACESLYWRR